MITKVFWLIAALDCSRICAQTADPLWVPGSTQKICQLTGDTDVETHRATASRTETNYGLFGSDLGYSFEHNGKLWILFGDSIPSVSFGGRPNGPTTPPRVPSHNDSIAFTTSTDPCLKVDFVRSTTGAYQSPVPINAQGTPAFTLASFEIPIAGIDVGGRMFVIFATEKNDTFATRSVVTVSDDDGVTYRLLYNFSAPSCLRCDGAKFINVAIGNAASSSLKDGYLYFWGSQGGAGYRRSSVYLGRKLASNLAQPGGMQYYTGTSAGTPNWSASESDSVPLFQDVDGSSTIPTPCVGELAVEYNTFLQRWVMLYNCANRTLPSQQPGILMRFAPQPWGPWSAPQLIFNSQRDRGECFFLHRAVTASVAACDEVNNPNREDQGGPYAPYFLSRFTTGASATDTSTFYYLLSTWNPYTEVVMKTTVQSPGQPAPVIGLVANAAGEKASIAPNTWIEIKGLNLARPGANRIWQGSDFTGNRMPTQLDGVSVRINGQSAFVYYISPTQVNVLTPPAPISGRVEVVLTNNGATATYSATAETTSPSLFVVDNIGNIAAIHSNGGLIGPLTLFPGVSTPARLNETISIFANGLGPTSVPVENGALTQTGTLSPVPTVVIGGERATVTFAGLVSPGQYQLNVTIPASLPTGNHRLSIAVNGIATQGKASIFVQR